MTLQIEKALIRNQWPTTLPHPIETSPISTRLAYGVIQGRFREVLTSPTATELFQVQTLDGPLNRVFGLLSNPAEEEEELIKLIIAIALIHAFIQENWTGPCLDFLPSDILPPTLFEDDGISSKSISELAYGGEPVYHLSKYPVYLRLAQIILIPGGSYEGMDVSNLTRLKTAPWWVLRLILLHQQILDEPVPPHEQYSSALTASIESIITLCGEGDLDCDLSTRILLDQGLLSHNLSQDKVAASLFNRAIQASGMRYEVTGVPGKRTKFQQENFSQLVVLAESRLKSAIAVEPSPDTDITSESEATKEVGEAGPTLPKTLALNDDTLLETTRYSSNMSSTSLSHIDPSSQPPLHPLDQAILLALNLSLTATSPASDPLTSSQSSAYISRVLSHPFNWSIHTMALLSRSRLEATRTRTVERAVLQIQALVDQMPSTNEEKVGKMESEKGAGVRERLEYFWELLLPSRWTLEKELADKLFSIGIVKSSLEIYEKLEMWEEVVKCYSALEKPENGIAIVKDLLEGRKREVETVIVDGKTTVSKEKRRFLDRAREAKLLCLLGDLEPDNAVAHYRRAWNVSRETSSRAMRSLGGIYFSQNKYHEAIDCLRRAVKINPLVGRAWFILGCTAMRLEDWEEAREAFTRCVRIDEEDAESWSNLASVYLRMPAGPTSASDDLDSRTEGVDAAKSRADSVSIEHKLLAYRALKQGIKFSYSNWKMWYNYMIVSVDVGELLEAARALGRIVEETSGRSAVSSSSDALDLDVVDRLVDAVTKGASGSAEVGQAFSTDENVKQQNSGMGGHQPTADLGSTVTKLFEATLLPKVSSSPRLFRAYAKLMTAQRRWDDTLKAYLDAYRVGVAGTWGSRAADDENQGAPFKDAVKELEETVDLLRNFGPMTERASENRWKGQAKSIVRTLIARTKEEHEGEEGWFALVQLLEELKTA